MHWARVTGLVDQELLARNEYPLKSHLKARFKGRLQLSDAERATLGEIGHRLGRKVLAEVANVARPDTILAWYRQMVARKFDGSHARRGPGRPRIQPRDRATDRPHGQGEQGLGLSAGKVISVLEGDYALKSLARSRRTSRRRTHSLVAQPLLK